MKRAARVAGCVLLGLVGCTSTTAPAPSGRGTPDASITADAGGAGGPTASAPSPTMDTSPSNPNVSPTPPGSPNGAPATVEVADAGAGRGNADAAADAGGGRSWPTVECVGGPCAAPNVCVNLDFLFVACVACGGNDQVCCPPYRPGQPWTGACDPGLVCAPNPNFQSTPPLDLVQDVCQTPGSPPPSSGGLNHQRAAIP